MTSTVAALLGEFGVTSSESEFVAALRTALNREARAGTVTLTEPEAAVLAEHSGVDAAAAAANSAPPRVAVERARIEFDLLRHSYTVGDIAAKWGVDTSRIRHRVRNKALYGVRVGRALRLPEWQFDNDLRPLAGLGALLDALPEGIHPREVEGFMTTPQDELRLRGRKVSPRDWLLSGGSPDRVVAHAVDLDLW
jgi:hypothetical protein